MAVPVLDVIEHSNARGMPSNGIIVMSTIRLAVVMAGPEPQARAESPPACWRCCSAIRSCPCNTGVPFAREVKRGLKSRFRERAVTAGSGLPLAGCCTAGLARRRQRPRSPQWIWAATRRRMVCACTTWAPAPARRSAAGCGDIRAGRPQRAMMQPAVRAVWCNLPI